MIDSPHSSPLELVLDHFRVDEREGLSAERAEAELQRSGANVIPTSAERPVWKLFLSQFSSIIVWLLLTAATVSAVSGAWFEAGAIVVVLLLNALIGFFTEWQAGRSIEALRGASAAFARVRRNGSESMIDAARIVPGDVIILVAGDRVPADARLAESASLRIDESALTGESVPVEKQVAPVPKESALADRRSMIYLGTYVQAGRCVAVVTATGRDTELGQVGRLLTTTPELKTPMEKRLADLGRRLVFLVICIAVIVLAAGLVRGDQPLLIAKVAISLAVAAVPEGLPAVTTLILALGVLRMARSRAIVRHLIAVETLGSATVICTDKTGTLTLNRMTVREIVLADGTTIDLHFDDRPNLDGPATDSLLHRLIRVAVLCNEAPDPDGTAQASLGDPTETALLAAAGQLGIGSGTERAKYRKLHDVPFDSMSKRMTRIYRSDEGKVAIMVKGAPSVVLGSCDFYLDSHGVSQPMEASGRASFHSINDGMAEKGLRVLAFADHWAESESDLTTGQQLTFLGFVGMSDPPRTEVPQAILDAKKAGIRIVMLTGDQVLTAKAIASELGISENHDVVALHSKDVSEADEDRLIELSRRAHVFARVTPEDKLRIVRGLQSAGEVVAVTGDGINDAPALKQADIGIAMGLRGTDVAKESSDIILTDDNFATIVHAVEGGRTIYANIIKFVHLMFSHNLGEILVIFIAILASLPLPLLPLQILWINLITDIFPAFALALEPPGQDTMRRRPRPRDESFLSLGFMILIFWQGAMLAGVALGAYTWGLYEYGEGAHARTIALLGLVAVQLGHLLNCRSRTRSAFDGFFGNPFIFVSMAIVVTLQLLAVYIPYLRETLGLEIPNMQDWIVILIAAVLPVLIVEGSKAIRRMLKPEPMN